MKFQNLPQPAPNPEIPASGLLRAAAVIAASAMPPPAYLGTGASEAGGGAAAAPASGPRAGFACRRLASRACRRSPPRRSRGSACSKGGSLREDIPGRSSGGAAGSASPCWNTCSLRLCAEGRPASKPACRRRAGNNHNREGAARSPSALADRDPGRAGAAGRRRRAPPPGDLNHCHAAGKGRRGGDACLTGRRAAYPA